MFKTLTGPPLQTCNRLKGLPSIELRSEIASDKRNTPLIFIPKIKALAIVQLIELKPSIITFIYNILYSVRLLIFILSFLHYIVR